MEYTVIRSSRKTVSIEYRDGRVILRAPRNVPETELRRIVLERRDWIEKQAEKYAGKQQELAHITPLTADELKRLKQLATAAIPPRVSYYAKLLGIRYGTVTVRAQRTRWGSCSREGNLSFNCLLMLAPGEALDSVIVHELCHRLEMNHSPRFYRLVRGAFPDYDIWSGWLKEHSAGLMKRLPDGKPE